MTFAPLDPESGNAVHSSLPQSSWGERRRVFRITWRTTVLPLLVGILALTGCGSENGPSVAANEAIVSPADITEWPFAVDSGILRCDGAGSVTFETDDGTVYAINGTALTVGAGEDIRESDIWLPNPDAPEAKISMGEVIERGLELCEA